MGTVAGVLSFGAYSKRIAPVLYRSLQHRVSGAALLWERGHVALVQGSQSANSSHGISRLGTPSASVAVVADGRVTNRSSLSQALGLGHCDSPSNADLLCGAWRKWGEEMWRHVTGDYALAAWDADTGQLTLARDRVGARPLFWTRTEDFVAFASEPEALLALPGVSTSPNMDRVASWLVPAFSFEDRAGTFYGAIRRVLPGTTLTFHGGGQPRERVCSSFVAQPPLTLAGPDEALELFSTAFDAAVRDAIDPGSTGVMLSGGIDSASVHASALRQGLPLQRLAVVADTVQAPGERENIDAMLRQSAGDATAIHAACLWSHADMPRLLHEVFERAHPIRNSMLLPMVIGQIASSAGIHAMLDGIDGDLVMNSPDDYAGRLALAGQPRHAWRESRAAARHNTYLKHRSAEHILARGLATLLEPTPLALLRSRFADLHHGTRPFSGVLHPSLVKSLHLRERTLERRLSLHRARLTRDWSAYLAWSWANPGFMRGMEGFDLTLGRFGIDSRHPWCDGRVIDLFLRLPLDVVVREGWTKWIARKAYKPQLGRVAWHSGKRHFGPAITRAVIKAGAEHVSDALADSERRLEEIIDPLALVHARREWSTHAERSEHVDLILSLVTLQRWLGGLADIARHRPMRVDGQGAATIN